jgi:hypothetical protein
VGREETQFQPGQSGNPKGRPKSKPITETVKVSLEEPVRGKSGKTKRQALVDRLIGIALTGKRSEAIQAMKLILAYSDGLPTQRVEHDFYDAARRAAEERGLNPDRVIHLYEQLKRQKAG